MATIVISTTDVRSDWDDDNSVKINTAWHLVSDNTWMYASGNMSIVNGVNGGTWLGSGSGIQFTDKGGKNSFSLHKNKGEFSSGDSFSHLPLGEQGIATSVNPDNETWTLTAR